MKNIAFFLLLAPSVLIAQRFKQELNFNTSGDQTMALGRYRIGTAIVLTCQITGGWAEDGGVYHIASDWGSLPKVVYRGESSISTRLKFYGYVDPQTQLYAYLFATWDNQSPNGADANYVKFTVTSEGDFNTTNLGTFANAVELPTMLVVQSNTGNVGIGTNTPSEKLSVNGTIRSREVKVEAAPWPDYVFEEGYDLLSLTETEQYIQENGHLPNIPSAQEVALEGIALGEMNARLLEKIEELTLYLIQQQKQLEEQQQQIEWLKAQMLKKE